jgi:hypothetical protein
LWRQDKEAEFSDFDHISWNFTLPGHEPDGNSSRPNAKTFMVRIPDALGNMFEPARKSVLAFALVL